MIYDKNLKSRYPKMTGRFLDICYEIYEIFLKKYLTIYNIMDIIRLLFMQV